MFGHDPITEAYLLRDDPYWRQKWEELRAKYKQSVRGVVTTENILQLARLRNTMSCRWTDIATCMRNRNER